MRRPPFWCADAKTSRSVCSAGTAASFVLLSLVIAAQKRLALPYKLLTLCKRIPPWCTNLHFLRFGFEERVGFALSPHRAMRMLSPEMYIPRGQGSEYSSALGDRACRCERCHWKARGRNPAPAPPAAELASAAEIIVANFS